MARRIWGFFNLVLAAVALAGTACATSTANDEATPTSSSSTSSSPTSSSPANAPETTASEATERVTETSVPRGATIARVIDGDTLTLTDGRRVRLAQVDAPETNECFGSESTAALRTLAPEGQAVTLRRPDDAPARDKYGRTLAEIYVDATSVDEALIRDGAAEWYEQFGHEDDDLARRLQVAEADARSAGRGLWSRCKASGTTPPALPTTTASPPPLAASPTDAQSCDASYPDVCIAPYPPDLNCANVGHTRFRVLAPDPHGFDGDNDGVGCES